MQEPEPNTSSRRKRNLILFFLGGFFLIILILWILYFVLYGRFFVKTDDAYVSGNQVVITPQVASGIVAINADNTDFVTQGQVLVELDTSNFEIALSEKKSILANTVRDVRRLFDEVRQQEALVEVRKAEWEQKKLNLANRVNLRESRAISTEEYEITSTDVKVAENNYLFAKEALAGAKALVAGTTVETHPRVQEAIAALKEAYLNLIRCKVVSPATGYVAKRSAQVGDWIAAGQVLMIVVPLDYLWYDANYKETQLKNVRIGQSVTFTADLYGNSVAYHGKVVGFTSGTGSAFQLLPAQNATGNWIKIVQRLPVRISIDSEELKEHPLFIGLSIRSSIDVHDTSGKMLCTVPQTAPVYATYLYDCQMKSLEEFQSEIEKIIACNSNLP